MSTTPAGPLWRVPELPPHYLPRSGDTAALVQALLADIDQSRSRDQRQSQAQPVGIASASRHGVHGMGGIGKSVLAAAVVRSEAVRARFVHGVYWLTVGQTPQLTSLQAQLGKALGLADTAFESPADGKQRLTEHLAERTVLLVLDDVWHAEHASWLDVVGAPGRILMTTRNLDVLTWRDATVHALDIMSGDQARALLAAWTGADLDRPAGTTGATAEPDEATQVADACGRLPLALAVAGAMVRKPGGSWTRVLGLLRDARLQHLRGQIPAYPYRNVYQVIAASVTQLASEDIVPDAARCYAELAVFAEDEVIPRAALRVLWGRHGLDDTDLDELASALATCALASLDTDAEQPDSWRLCLHDIQGAYVRACVGDGAQLAALHGAFVDAFAARCAYGLECGPDAEDATPDERAYFFARLPYHLVQADRSSQLRDLLCSYRWLDAKLRATNLAEVIGDFGRLPGAGGADPLPYLRDALRLSSSVLAESSDQLPSQLCGRLAPHRAEFPALAALLRSAEGFTRHPWWCPGPASLTTPGGALLCTLSGHVASVRSLALSADGSVALSGSDDRTIRVWHVASGQCVQTLRGHRAAVWALAIDHQARMAVSACKDGVVRVWDLGSGECVRTVEDWTTAHNATLAMSRDGKWLVFAHRARVVVLDLARDRIVHTLAGHEHIVRALALSDDGAIAVSGSIDRTVKVWDTRRGQLLHAMPGHIHWVRTLAVSADGKRAVSGSSDRTLKVWDTERGALLHTLQGHTEAVRSVTMSADGTTVVSVSDDRTLRTWDARSGRLLDTLEAHDDRIWSVAMDAAGNVAASGSDDRAVKIWNIQGRSDERASGSHRRWIRALAVARDRERIISSSLDGTVAVRDSAGSAPSAIIEGLSQRVRALAMSDDGSLALAGCSSGELALLDTDAGALVRTIQAHDAPINAVALHLGRGLALSAANDGTARVLQLRSGQTDTDQTIHVLDAHTGPVLAAALSPSGAFALTGGADRRTIVWDPDRGASLVEAPAHTDRVTCVAFSPDERTIAAGSRDGAIHVRDRESGDLRYEIRGHRKRVVHVGFVGDGAILVSASADRRVKAWDTASGEPVATFFADRTISTASAGARSLRVAVGDEDGHLYPLQLRNPRSQLRASSERILTTSAHPEFVEDLFAVAVGLSPPEQAAFLDARCAHLPEVRRLVELLLRKDRESGAVLASTMTDVPGPGVAAASAARDTSALDLGATLGEYRITRELGRGGMGVVYAAEHVNFGNQAVIKTLRSRYANDVEAIERFKDEAHALARIRHPSIVTVYGGGVHQSGQVYIVLEQLDGESLEDRLRAAHKLEPATALAFTQQAARALAAVHAEGIIHRDLKPDNLFVVPDPEVPGGERIKILDFGIAKLGARLPDDEGAHQTAGNVAMGTPPYMPPEQWRDARTADARTDLYALGVILFRMLTGRLPFERANLLEYMCAHTSDAAPAVREFEPHLPREVDELIARLLAKQPDERFASARDLVAAIDTLDSRTAASDTLH